MRKRLVLISEKFNNYSIKIRFVNSVCTTQWCLNVDEREKKSSPYLSSTQWYSNIFWVGKPIKRNDLIWAFWGHQGRFWGWKKKLAFQLCFTCYGIFPTRNALKPKFFSGKFCLQPQNRPLSLGGLLQPWCPPKALVKKFNFVGFPT